MKNNLLIPVPDSIRSLTQAIGISLLSDTVILNAEDAPTTISTPGAIVVTGKFLFESRKSTIEIRKRLIENIGVNTVIQLPCKLMGDTNMSCTLILLGEHSDNIRFVDASDEFVSDKLTNRISDENIKNITNIMQENDAKSKVVSIDEITSNHYIISPTSYIFNGPHIENSVPFETLIIKIVSRNSDAKRYITDHPTSIMYVTAKDICNGEIQMDLPYVEDETIDGCYIKNNDIIISTSGGKVAVVDIPENINLIPNPNIIGISIDTNKIDPYHIKRYLSSKIGQEWLRNCCVGDIIPKIQIDRLKQIPIPSDIN